MTNIGKAESFYDGFLRAALEVIAKRDEREAIIDSQDFDGLKQRLDRSPSTTCFTQPMAEFYLGIPRRYFDKLKREHGNPFAGSKSSPRSITKAEL
ncbi:hypothetical protein XPU_1555, partial [Xanthomonas arboricola pv. pruni str. MAFF 311562]